MRSRLVILALCGLALAPCAPAGADTAPADIITDAAFAKGRLWLLSSTNALSSVAPGETRRARVKDLPGRVLALCVRGGWPTALVGQGLVDRQWEVHRLGEAGWSREATITSEELAWPWAMVCDETRLTVVTRERLITREKGRQTSVPLVGRPHKGVLRAVAAAGNRIFLGRYAGEWGGGLDAIDRDSGRIVSIEGRLSGPYCKRPLDPACDPVTGIADEPWKPGCVVAAVGLRHMSPSGRLVEVCGDAVTEIYHKPYGRLAPSSTLPFDDVQRVGETLRAIGDDGLYTIDPAGVRQTSPIPKLDEIDGVALSFAVPGVVVLKPSSYGTPVLVAR